MIAVVVSVRGGLARALEHLADLVPLGIVAVGVRAIVLQLVADRRHEVGVVAVAGGVVTVDYAVLTRQAVGGVITIRGRDGVDDLGGEPVAIIIGIGVIAQHGA